MEHTETGPGRTPVACGRGEAVERRGDLIELRVVDSVALVRLNRPVVAAVNGTAIAGGFELVLACDVVFAAAEVRMGDGHLRYGYCPVAGERSAWSGRSRRMLPGGFAGYVASDDLREGLRAFRDRTRS